MSYGSLIVSNLSTKVSTNLVKGFLATIFIIGFKSAFSVIFTRVSLSETFFNWIHILNLNGTTTLNLAFTNCKDLGNSGVFNAWNVSQVTDMRYMFFGASSFNQPLDSWDVSHVTDMYSMFSGASSFDQPLDAWNVSRVTNMQDMFSRASSFNSPIGTWNVRGSWINRSPSLLRAINFPA